MRASFQGLRLIGLPGVLLCLLATFIQAVAAAPTLLNRMMLYCCSIPAVWSLSSADTSSNAKKCKPKSSNVNNLISQ